MYQISAHLDIQNNFFTQLKGKIKSSTLIVGDFSAPTSVMMGHPDRNGRIKLSLDQRTFHPKATKYILFLISTWKILKGRLY